MFGEGSQGQSRIRILIRAEIAPKALGFGGRLGLEAAPIRSGKMAFAGGCIGVLAVQYRSR
jgi:hypothetical protein